MWPIYATGNDGGCRCNCFMVNIGKLERNPDAIAVDNVKIVGERRLAVYNLILSPIVGSLMT